MRIRRVRKRDRSRVAVLVSGLGLYAVLSVGFHWFVEPAILADRSSLPTETLMAQRNSSSEEPVTSGHSLRGAAQTSFDKSELPRPADPPPTAPADQAEIKAPDVNGPKKEPHRRQANDRVANILVKVVAPRGTFLPVPHPLIFDNGPPQSAIRAQLGRDVSLIPFWLQLGWPFNGRTTTQPVRIAAFIETLLSTLSMRGGRLETC